MDKQVQVAVFWGPWSEALNPTCWCRCWIKVINNCQALDKGTLALGLSKDLQEGVLFLCVPDT